MICWLPLQIRLCQPPQEGVLGGMCFTKLLHCELETGFIFLANSKVMQIQ